VGKKEKKKYGGRYVRFPKERKEDPMRKEKAAREKSWISEKRDDLRLPWGRLQARQSGDG